MSSVSKARREQITSGLIAANERIRAAEVASARTIGSVGLVVVTKTFPAEEVGVLADLGVLHVGENRDQEAAPKAKQLGARGLVWHFIGQLQTNKARSVVGYASVVESVDRPRLVTALSRSATELGRVVECLVQVSLDGEPQPGPGRGGASVPDVPALASQIADAPGLELGGVMAVAPLTGDPDAAFARLEEVATGVRNDHPEATAISAGMSSDLEAAVRHGATHVRLGSAILGYRPQVG